jgi:hypothetical protein
MNLNDARIMLEAYLDNDQPAMLWGPPGSGKSSLVRQIVADRKWGLIDFRASTRDNVAVMGLPDLAGETTRWKVPDEFPQVERDGEEGILFLDEINAAAPSMQAALFGLVLDRKVGEYVCPPGWRIVAAGNRQSDRAAAQRMPSALANRFGHIDVDPDVDTVTQHFIKKNVDPILIAFLRFRKALLFSMEGSDLRAFASPRSWESSAKYINHPPRIRLQLVSGLVGEGNAAELEGFIRIYKELPSLDLVLANPNSAPVPQETSACYAIASGLARKVDARTFANGMAYMGRLKREFEIMFAVDAVRRDPGLSHTQAFTEWAVRNQDVTIG